MLQAYQQTQKVTESPRGTEYRLFAEITRAMMNAKGLPTYDPAFTDAVDRNRKLWNLLIADLADEGNAFPDQLKASLISIGIWVGKHTTLVIRGEADIAPLIDVNRDIMEGLAQRPE